MYRKTAVFNGIQKHMKPLREYPNGKTFSHLQNDIFCHFDFCHNRRNDLADSPCWSVLDFWKINLEKSSSKNWIYSLFRTWFLLPVQPAQTNFEIDFCRLKIQFVKLDFFNLLFQSSSTDQQGDCLVKMKKSWPI